MSITEGTQPVAKTWTGAWTTAQTTAAFTPEAGALLVAIVSADGDQTTGAVTASITDSLSGTWTLLKRQNTTSANVGGTAEIWCRDSPNTSMTVSATGSGHPAGGGQLTVRTLIGALATASQNGATAGATSDPAAARQISVAAGTGNAIYGAAFNWDASTAMTVLANTTAVTAFVDSVQGDNWAAFKSAADTAGTATYGYSTSVRGMIAAVEIKAAATAVGDTTGQILMLGPPQFMNANPGPVGALIPPMQLWQPWAQDAGAGVSVETYSHPAASSADAATQAAGLKAGVAASPSVADGQTQAAGFKVAAGATSSSAGAQTRAATVKVAQKATASAATGQTRAATAKVGQSTSQTQADAQSRAQGVKLGQAASRTQAYDATRTAAATARAAASGSAATATDVPAQILVTPVTGAGVGFGGAYFGEPMFGGGVTFTPTGAVSHPSSTAATAADRVTSFKVATGATRSSAGASTRAATAKVGLSVSTAQADAADRPQGAKTGAASSLSAADASTRAPGATVRAGTSRSQAYDATRSAGSKVTAGASRSQAAAEDALPKAIGHGGYQAANDAGTTAGFKVASGSTSSAASAQARTVTRKAALGTVASTADGQTRTVGVKVVALPTRTHALASTRAAATKLVANVSRSAAFAADRVDSHMFIPVTAHSYAAGPYATHWGTGPCASAWQGGPYSTHWDAGPRSGHWRPGPYATDIDGG